MKKIVIEKKQVDKKITPSKECLENINHIKFINMYYLDESFNEKKKCRTRIKKEIVGL